MSNPTVNPTRRQFGLGLCALPFAGLATEAAAELQAMPWNEPANVAKVYVAQTVLHWPKPTLDLGQEMKEVEAHMAEVARKHARNVRFTGATLVKDIAQGVAKKMLIREVPIQTRYFDEASQIGFWRASRYGLAILKTMVLYKLHKKHIYSHRIFRDPAPAPAAVTAAAGTR